MPCKAVWRDGEKCSPSLSLSRFLSALLKKRGPVAVLGAVICLPSPPHLAARRSSPTVHKSGAAYSQNYPESSSCNKLSGRCHPDFITLRVQTVLFSTLHSLLSHLQLSISPSVCHILNFLEIRTHPATVRMKTKAGIITRSSSPPNVLGGYGAGYEKCFQK